METASHGILYRGFTVAWFTGSFVQVTAHFLCLLSPPCHQGRPTRSCVRRNLWMVFTFACISGLWIWTWIWTRCVSESKSSNWRYREESWSQARMTDCMLTYILSDVADWLLQLDWALVNWQKWCITFVWHTRKQVWDIGDRSEKTGHLLVLTCTCRCRA